MKTTLAMAIVIPLLVYLALAFAGPQYNANTGRIYIDPSVTMPGTTTSIGGSLLVAGACNTVTLSVPGATTSMAVVVSPSGGTAIGAGITWFGQVTSAGTVTVSECAIVAATPATSTFQVRVIR